MNETVVKIQKGKYPKKYIAFVKNDKTKDVRKISFGDQRYQQYKDKTKLKLYKNKDHNDIKRKEKYYLRFSGTKNRKEAINKEIKKSNGKYNAKLLAHILLW